MESYDFECVDCTNQFDVSDAVVKDTGLTCPKCGSDDLLDLCEE